MSGGGSLGRARQARLARLEEAELDIMEENLRATQLTPSTKEYNI